MLGGMHLNIRLESKNTTMFVTKDCFEYTHSTHRKSLASDVLFDKQHPFCFRYIMPR